MGYHHTNKDKFFRSDYQRFMYQCIDCQLVAGNHLRQSFFQTGNTGKNS
jgi:hypothetical protein